MRLHYPLNSNGAEDAGELPWTDGVPLTGVEGSYPGHAIVTDTEAEILAAIDAAGLVRNGSDLTQLVQAIARGGLWIGQFAGTATTLTATLPNAITLPSLQAGMRVRGIAASNYTGSGGTLAITGIGGTANAVSYPLIGSDGVTPLSSGAWKAGQFLTFDIDASGNARFGGAGSSGFVLTSASLMTATVAASQTFNQNGAVNPVVFGVPGTLPSWATSYDGTTLTIAQAGLYLFDLKMSARINVSNADYLNAVAEILLNGTALPNGTSAQFTSSVSGTFNLGTEALQIVSLAAGARIQTSLYAAARAYWNAASVQPDGTNVFTACRLA